MASPQRPTDKPPQPAGAAGDGMEPYPTYHDGSAPSRAGSGAKPTDVDLPRSQRTFGLPMFLGLIAFALAIIVYLVWGSINMAGRTDEAMSPGDPASPPAAGAPAAEAASGAAPETPVPLGEEQPQTTTGPGEVEAAPGAADVPGGASTTPAGEAPAPTPAQ